MNEIFVKEEDFHDEWAKSINLDEVLVDESFEACTCPENKYILSKLGDIKDKKILELGCGAGESSVYFAKQGADVTATDISGGMLKVVQSLASKHNTSLSTKKSLSDEIDFEDETFDIVYAANLLHHVDIEKTLIEAKRVLKKSGTFVCWDPIAHNPLINIYRKMATEVRTEDEHPLKMSDLKFFRKHFSQVEYHTTWFFTLFLFVKFFLIDRINPNKERYWKKIIVEHKKLEKLYNKLENIDKFILKICPALKRYCWNIVIISKK